MSWITFIWSMTAGICLTLGAVHFVIWTRRRNEWANLIFSITAAAAAGYAVLDMVALHAQTPAEYGALWRWALSLGMLEGVLIVWFIRLYLRAGRLWLLWLICGLRALMLVLNFMPGANFYFREITLLQQVPLLGETISRPHGVLHSWVMLMPLSFLLIILFAIDAAHTASRRSGPRRAWVLGGLMAVGFSLGLVSYALYAKELLPSTFSSQLLLLLMLLMGYELSLDVLRAGELSRSLQQSEQQMDVAARAASLGIWSRDLARDEIWASEVWRALFGFSKSERLPAERFIERLHPDDRDKVRNAFSKAVSEKGSYETEYRVLLPDGRTRWIASRGGVETNAEGNPIRMRGVSIDITELKGAKERFRLVVEASPNGIVLVGSDGRIVLVNAETERLFGYSREEMIGSAVETLLPERFRGAHPGLRGGFFAAPQARAMGIGRELFGRRKDGTEFAVEIGLSPILSAEATLVLTAIVDITARKQAEMEMQSHRAELAHVTRVSTIGQLASSLAHELNQPLGAILRNAEAAELLLQSDPPDLDEIRAILADICKDDQRAGAVIDRTRAMLERRPMVSCTLTADVLVEEVMALTRADAASRHVIVQVELTPGLPPVTGDRVQLQQVLLNLMLNGMDAMSDLRAAERRLVVRTRRTDDMSVEIAVSDSGRGIPADKLAKVFQPFFTTKPNGLGMGLAISRTIVEAHGGRLWARNNPDRGATVAFSLPVAQEGTRS